MPVKLLNIIIALSILGILGITVKDVMFPKREEPVKKTAEVISPTTVPVEYSPTPSSSQAQAVPCTSTFIGDIQFTTLQYRSKTNNKLAIDLLESSSEASTSLEVQKLKLASKTESSYTFNLDPKNEVTDILEIQCSVEGVHADLLGNAFLLIPTGTPKKGDTWTSPLSLSAPGGFGAPMPDLGFQYTVTNSQTRTLFGSARQELTIEVMLDTMKAMEYTVVSGVGLRSATINIDLKEFGSYSKDIVLESAS